MTHASTQCSGFTSVLLVSWGLLFLNSLCQAEVLIQDVLWSKEYDEGLEENYFGMCTFVPSPCGMNNEGVCVQRCAKHNGMPFGDCQGGVGECCIFSDSCRTGRSYVDVNQLVTILETPENRTTPCSLRIPKEPKICQVRLDFLEFLTESADMDGTCHVDKLHIKNSITVDKDFTTCGTLSGQHMYLTFGEDGDMIEVTPIIKSLSSRYRIAVTKIPCNSKRRAPDYCLQYYTEPYGMVNSLDFGRQQQNNQRYTICVKPSGHSTKIQWRPCSGISDSFHIITSSLIELEECNTDWVKIKGLGKTCEPFFQQESSWKSYEVMVNFDGMEVPPLPPSFGKPIVGECSASNCASVHPLICDCVGDDPVNQQCQCTMDSSVIGPIPDFGNTGFCLEYSQE